MSGAAKAMRIALEQSHRIAQQANGALEGAAGAQDTLTVIHDAVRMRVTRERYEAAREMTLLSEVLPLEEVEEIDRGEYRFLR